MSTESQIFNPHFYQQIDSDEKRIKKEGQLAIAGFITHIRVTHFYPAILGWLGVPIYDLNLLKNMDLPTNSIVGSVYEKLENGWPGGGTSFDKNPSPPSVFGNLNLPWNEDWCKFMLVKTLIYIEQLRLAEINWGRVTTAVPSAKTLDFDPTRDCYDSIFQEEKPFPIPKIIFDSMEDIKLETKKLAINKSPLVIRSPIPNIIH